MNDKNKFFRIGRFQLVLYALIAVLLIASILMADLRHIPDWEKCKESLFTQMFSDECTPRRGSTQDKIDKLIESDRPATDI